MKKVFMAIAVLTGLVASGMVFSSFTISNKTEATPSVIEILDDGWEYYTSVGLMTLSRNGEFNPYNLTQYEVQRRAWCGEKEYRIIFNKTPYIVRRSGNEDYPFCFDVRGYGTFYFRM